MARDQEPPMHLRKDARAEWTRLLSTLPRGLVTEADRSLLAILCTVWGDLIAADQDIGKRGLIIADRNGAHRNPAVLVRSKLIDQFGRLAAEFAMSPSARTRLDLPVQRQLIMPTAPGDAEEDGAPSLEEYLAEGRRLDGLQH